MPIPPFDQAVCSPLTLMEEGEGARRRRRRSDSEANIYEEKELDLKRLKAEEDEGTDVARHFL